MQEVLYRKYRPLKFADVIGQDHIVKGLEVAIKSGDLPHAFIFSGGRGTGKTSVARILATELGIKKEDIYEIDAASNRGIDDIRSIKESVSSVPFASDYKIYIIDEVHMLSKDAFNALLKTIEEPPAYAFFVLATTEFEKIPETIVSRCVTYDFKKPGEAVLEELVTSVSKKEKVSIDKDAAELIAFLGDGSFRDTLSNLQKVLISTDEKKINFDHVAEITGAPKKISIRNMLSAISESRVEDALSIIREESKMGRDVEIFYRLFIAEFRLALIARYAPKLLADFADSYSKEDIDFLMSIGSAKSKTITSSSLAKLIGTLHDIRYAPVPSLPLEIAILEICSEATS
ncbi:MAG: DNA polymerase III subunit gamma/tau [Candidatus Nomurabacteria bacterium]|nr:MAG: DNA polymerase III subunit gamma/tau [Candidatus Nomurabacteria bacterium]